MNFFDAHNHLQDFAPGAELAAALAAAQAAGVKAMLCCATRPGDWARVLEISKAQKGIVPCFGVHPWFCADAAGDWQEKLAGFLVAAPACVGEIGLDALRGGAGQEEIFRAQLLLAKKLCRQAVIHCVKSWDRLKGVLKETRPGAFLLHAYGGPAELAGELAELGAYFSFGGEIADPAREKLRRALKAAPRGRLLFESEAPAAAGRRAGPAGVAEAVKSAAALLGAAPEELAELSYNNGLGFLGGQLRNL
ncbi:MAG TPA: TatD family hydrolase [Elusimicrobiales bacterium]|nr:TatD family hydrolase [Elusimicrobiales bacterium]